MKKQIQFGLAAAALCLATAAGAASTATTEYLKKAGAGDLYEKQSSQIVLKSTKDAHVRSVADTMIKDHTKSTQMVKTAATQSGLHPSPPMLDAKQKGMIGKLTAAKGTDRDKLYLDQQKGAHQEALALHQEYSKTGDVKALRTTAGEIVPVVQHHIEMLNQM